MPYCNGKSLILTDSQAIHKLFLIDSWAILSDSWVILMILKWFLNGSQMILGNSYHFWFLAILTDAQVIFIDSQATWEFLLILGDSHWFLSDSH